MPNTPLLGITQVASSQNNKEITINDAILALENATNAKLDVSFASSADITLSNTQATRSFIFIATSGTAASTLRFPNTIAGNAFNRVFSVRNTCGYALTVRFQTGTGSTVVIPNGETRLIAALDGTDMIVAAQPGTAITLLSLTDTPDSYVSQAGKFLAVNVAENALEFVAAASFPSFISNAGKVLAVNAGASGVEWIDVSPATDFLTLLDTPDSYTGQAGKLVAVNSAADGIEFVDAPDPEATLYASAQRWRILVIEKGTEPETGFGEVQFLDKDGINLVGTGTATSSNNGTGFEPGLAFDGLIVAGAGWRTEDTFVGEIWLEYNFGEQVSVRQVQLSPITDAAEFTPTRFKFQFWSGTAWVDVGDRTAQPWVSGSPQRFRVNGLPFVNLYPFGGFGFSAAPSSSQVLFRHVVTDACILADDFAGSRGSVGVNPSSAFVMSVAVNGVDVGSVTISTGGAFTFSTTGGAVSLTPGDLITVTAPASVGTAQNVAVTLRGIM